MPTKSINISATGPSWETSEWKNTVLRDLRSGEPCVFPACVFGAQPMAALVEAGLFRRDFPPGDGDLIGLEIDGEMAEFGVFRVRGEFHCDETRDANPRKLRYSEAELTMHTLIRERFYTMMATDLGVSAQVGELSRGIWELGRKSLPGQGRSKVIFIEDGVRESDLTLFLMRDGYNSHCLLFHGKRPQPPNIPGKTIAQAPLEVRDGRFASEIFEELAASQNPTAAETRIDLEVSPPKLWICGEEFTLPLAPVGMPTDGCGYLAHLFEHPGKSIPCWDLLCALRPALKGEVGKAKWSDESLDKRARSEFLADLRQAKAELGEIEADDTMPECEKERARNRYDALKTESGKHLNIAGKSRPLPGGDQAKNRQKVRKALKVVILHVQKQNGPAGVALATALGDGDPVTFRPPPEWGL